MKYTRERNGAGSWICWGGGCIARDGPCVPPSPSESQAIPSSTNPSRTEFRFSCSSVRLGVVSAFPREDAFRKRIFSWQLFQGRTVPPHGCFQPPPPTPPAFNLIVHSPLHVQQDQNKEDQEKEGGQGEANLERERHEGSRCGFCCGGSQMSPCWAATFPQVQNALGPFGSPAVPSSNQGRLRTFPPVDGPSGITPKICSPTRVLELAEDKEGVSLLRVHAGYTEAPSFCFLLLKDPRETCVSRPTPEGWRPLLFSWLVEAMALAPTLLLGGINPCPLWSPIICGWARARESGDRKPQSFSLALVVLDKKLPVGQLMERQEGFL